MTEKQEDGQMRCSLWCSDYAAYTWERDNKGRVLLTLVARWWYEGLSDHLKKVLPR